MKPLQISEGAFFLCAPGRAHRLGGASPPHTSIQGRYSSQAERAWASTGSASSDDAVTSVDVSWAGGRGGGF